MNRFVVTSVLLLSLVLAGRSAGDAQARRILQPSELCSDHSDTSIVTFEDANLEVRVREIICHGLNDFKDIFCQLMALWCSARWYWRRWL